MIGEGVVFMKIMLLYYGDKISKMWCIYFGGKKEKHCNY